MKTVVINVFRAAVWGLALLIESGIAHGQHDQGFRSHVIIVQFEEGFRVTDGGLKTNNIAFDRRAAPYGIRKMERAFPFLDHVQPTPSTRRNLLALRRTWYVLYGSDHSPRQVAEVLSEPEGVAYAEPLLVNRLFAPSVEPDDSLYKNQPYLTHLRLPEAWGVVKGEDGVPPVVVAVVDGGSEWFHEDLADNVWTNPDEIPENGMDDDSNGFIDDVHGINFANGDDSDNDPTGLSLTPQNAMHGTSVAGTAGAVTNNGVGIAGAAWNARLMHINAGCPIDDAHICFGYEGLLYAAANGADVINASWGGVASNADQLLHVGQIIDLVTDMGALVVAAAGNRGRDEYYVPSSNPRVLAVGATESDSRRIAPFSNYGRSVDVFAPGMSILMTMPRNSYFFGAGTSFATPLVSGVAALAKTAFPGLSPDALREQVRMSAESIDTENPTYAGALGRGYVNAHQAVQAPTLPAVRIKRWTMEDSDGDGRVESGEWVELRVLFVNHLAPAQNLKVGLTTVHTYPFLNFTASEVIVGTLSSGDSTEAAFRFTVASDAPHHHPVELATRVEANGSEDFPDRISIGINLSLEVIHAALSALYVATDGSNWFDNHNWNIDVVPSRNALSSWFGIQTFDDYVLGLELERNNLQGSLPPQLADISTMRRLNLSWNSLGGTIPAAIAKLAQMRSLNLAINDLAGPIPPELGSLENLMELHLHYNELSGTIPAELGKLSALRVLDLNTNRLSGTIPQEFGSLSSIEVLVISDNDLIGGVPQEIGNLAELRILQLDRNRLKGKLPRSLMKLEKLETFFFFHQELCAPQDAEFQRWLDAVPMRRGGPNCEGLHFSAAVADQSFTVGIAINDLTLPEAADGMLPYSYALTPPPPPGLTFDSTARMLSGTPTLEMAKAVYTYTVNDAASASDSLFFTVEVVPSPLSLQPEDPLLEFALHGNYPNPFSEYTTILVDLPEFAEVTVTILDMLGRTIKRTSPIRAHDGEHHTIVVDVAGQPSGAYPYRVTAKIGDLVLARSGIMIRKR